MNGSNPDPLHSKKMNANVELLSQRLRVETREAHTTAERSGIMQSLLRGAITQGEYVSLLHNLAGVYGALETELQLHADNFVLRHISWRSLRRLPALRHDISILSPDGVLPELDDSTKEYIAHLHTLSRESPELLFAHGYLRYLGDLYGGQIIKRLMEKTFRPEFHGALTFYEFEGIPDLSAFKLRFHQAIDELPVSSDLADRLVSEVQRGYKFHVKIFSGLERGSSETV